MFAWFERLVEPYPDAPPATLPQLPEQLTMVQELLQAVDVGKKLRQGGLGAKQAAERRASVGSPPAREVSADASRVGARRRIHTGRSQIVTVDASSSLGYYLA